MLLRCLYALPTTSGHAPDEAADGALGDLLPYLEQGISQLMDSLWQYLAASDSLIHIPSCWIGPQLVVGQGNKRASHWHQCLHHAGTAYGICPHEAGHSPAPGGTQGPGPTIALRISSWNLTGVRVLFAMKWRSVCLPIPYLTHRQTGYAGWCYKQHNFPLCFGGLSRYCLPISPFICTKAGETDSKSLLFPDWTDWYPWSFTALMLYCSWSSPHISQTMVGL